MKRLYISAMLFSVFSLAGCSGNNEETSNKEKLYHEVGISQIKEDKFIVYKEMKDY